ncbi:MAG: hypothetical protein JWQ17_5654 [Tardiphaga sp.]|nr:hypothetical protein [Tardiphaga sp.]
MLVRSPNIVGGRWFRTSAFGPSQPEARDGIIFFYIILIFDPDELDAAMAEPRLIIG